MTCSRHGLEAPQSSSRCSSQTVSALWIISPGSIDEVGRIHTRQGLKLDNMGVIVGPDLVVREGQVETVLEARARQDQTIKGNKRMLKERPEETRALADRIIENTYWTLMTRRMKGCYLQRPISGPESTSGGDCLLSLHSP